MNPDSKVETAKPNLLHIALPKGRMQEGVFRLLKDAGVPVRIGARQYRPELGIEGLEAKILKPQSIIEMLNLGSRDIGFAGADWVRELGADLTELVDTRLDPVRIVVAAPKELLIDGALPKRRLVIATEYQQLAREWVAKKGLDATVVPSHGATEVFPPEDADCIVDNTATGATLKANGLAIVDDVMRSSTRFYAYPGAYEDASKRPLIDKLVMLLQSVLEARRRVMLELNVAEQDLEAIVKALPCMRQPTVSTLHGAEGYSVKAAVPKAELPRLIPELRELGGTDLVVYDLGQIVP